MKLTKVIFLLFINVYYLYGCTPKKRNGEITPNPVPTSISDTALMDTVQFQTFKYFWNFADPASGMARERNTSSVVTTGGSGFGVMAILVGIHRHFITREQGLDRILKIVGFLEKADRFHGAWSHWMNGSTGHVVPFSTYDDGGDLVETSYMIEGLLTAKEFFNGPDSAETSLRNRIQKLYEGVEWDWYQQGGKDVLYWHWSPDYGWKINMPITGWDEALIVYIEASSSPTHPISTSVYDNGWAHGKAFLNGQYTQFENGNIYEGVQLPLGPPYGGPLFFAHYSFLGLNPNGLKDKYADYFLQNKNQSLINYQYCINNPQNFYGYSENVWGLTASDDPYGYKAHSPTNDNGTISPTAAISSIVYTPVQSLRAMHYFYEHMKSKIWGKYGFYDAFNQQKDWYATSYLAIDEGPIIIMIENYRSGLLWNNFMKNTDIQSGLHKLGFTFKTAK
ncbi:MAG: hypothetical protein IEMM0006_2004 [bacterium]|nr:MAG: hypothetical protein IEMM0006_2004 [bacterium]